MKALFFSVLIPALLPVTLVLIYIWQKDKNEREPLGTVLLTVLFGAAVSLAAGPIELFLEKLLPFFFPKDSVSYSLIENFFGVALIEELLKWLVLMLFIWKNRKFNYSYDGVVYAVSSSLGFAAAENISYILAFGNGIAFSRAIFAIPGHACFGVFMGFFFSKAKISAANEKSFVCPMIMTVAVPTIVHGIYDFLLSPAAESISFSGFFTAYVIIIDILSFILIRNQFKHDKRLFPPNDGMQISR
ncbi:MAG: PrsW family intramembrane metalloprotease [Treponema sp.]|nr:PrsW family intramembrane metalloprotease [Treponema sp.]